jgi:uncharacterized protein (TIGR03435 family)
VGLPKWADTDRFDITALAPASEQLGPVMDPETIAPMMLALLADRFKMTYHTEARLLPAYSLVAVKPKIKTADPDCRISCKNGPAPAGAPPGSIMFTCQNTSMAHFADSLRNLALGLNTPVVDATGLEGGWDFTLTFQFPMAVNGPGRGATVYHREVSRWLRIQLVGIRFSRPWKTAGPEAGIAKALAADHRD